MKPNKFILNGEVIIDLSNDTVEEGDVLLGKTFHRADGEIVTGIFEGTPTKPQEEQTLELNMALGNQLIVPSEGKELTKATILKPQTLAKENILVDVNIGGVVGELLPRKEEEALVIHSDDIDFGSSSLITINPEEGRVFNSVGVYRSDELIEDNIRAGTTIYGITGNLAVKNETSATVYLDFSSGSSMMVYPDTSEETFSEVEVLMPDNLEPSNIVSGVNIAGVEGSYEAEGVNTELPPLDFTAGDMYTYSDPYGQLIVAIDVYKPDMLEPENIKKGVTIAGITGTMEEGSSKLEEEKTITLDLAEGDQTVLPSSGSELLSKITIEKPDTLIPANIRKDIIIAGVQGELEPAVEFKAISYRASYIGQSPTINSFIGYNFGAFDYTTQAEFVPATINKVEVSDYAVQEGAFYGCSNIEQIIIKNTDTIKANTFYNCASLEVLLLTQETLVPLEDVSAFTGTPESLKVYVFDALLNDYKASENWSIKKDNIYPISSYPNYIGYYNEDATEGYEINGAYELSETTEDGSKVIHII